MKRSPEMVRLEGVLRSSKLAAGGFLGDDRRPLEEIIEADARELAGLGYTRAEVADRMRHIGELAQKGIETTVRIDEGLAARMVEARGRMPCPWQHAGRYFKTFCEAWRTDTGQLVRWSDLSLHMIEAHGFFQGRHSAFRIEPRELVAVVFA